MKKLSVLIIMLAFSGLHEATGQWATNGNNIYNTNSGFVGIGDNSPVTLLYAAKSMKEPTITVRNLGGAGGASFRMWDDASQADWKFKATSGGGFKIRNNAFGMDVVVIESGQFTNALYINNNGYVGIGTDNPAARLQVTDGDALINNLTVGRGRGNNENNSVLGFQALFSNIGGGANSANGYQSLYSNTYGYNNTANGYMALLSNTSGWSNTAIGAEVLSSNTEGYLNTAIGCSALYTDYTGNLNTATGANSLYFNTTGNNNTANGTNALLNNTTGNSNVAVGNSALFSNTDRSNLVAIGDSALYNNGVDAVFDDDSKFNTAVGKKALYANTRGGFNTANGYQALYHNTTGNFNTAIGSAALIVNTTGNENTAVGKDALFSNTMGIENTANGAKALKSNTTGYANTANGINALYSNTEGYGNTAHGGSALFSNVTGSNNTAVGSRANYLITSSDNTSVGVSAGDYYTFSTGTFLGSNAYPNANGYSNCMALGYNARVDASNKAVIGNSLVTSIGGYAGWTTFPSDGAFKKNVNENVPGLAFISQLHPVTYNIDVNAITIELNRNKNAILHEGEMPGEETMEERESAAAKSKIVYTGFIAQDVEAAAKSIGYDFSGVDAPKDANGHYGLRYAEFVVPLVKAVQELSAKVEQLEKEIAELKGN